MRIGAALLCVALVLCSLVGGCAHHGAHAPSAAELPDDFALGLTVLPLKGSAMAPAWYVVEPDDMLRVALGERLPSSTYPPGVRRLSREQVRRIWELVVAGGLTAGNEPPLPHWQASAPNACAVVYVAAAGRRRSFAVPADRADAVTPLVAELRRVGDVRE